MNILADILVILAWFNNVICVCFAFEEKTCVCTSYMCAFQRYIYIYSSKHAVDFPMRHRKTACFEALVLEPG